MRRRKNEDVLIPAPPGRGAVIRDAVIYTPLALAGVGVLVWILVLQLFTDGGPSWVLFGVVAAVTLLVGFMSQAALRDLAAGPTEVSGRLNKKWKRTDSLFMRSSYFAVGGKILHVSAIEYELFKEGDHLAIQYYPHTGAVAAVEQIEAPESET